MKKKALIIGIGGQDAAYMSQLLISKDYKVYGIGRTLTQEKLWRLKYLGIDGEIELISGDLTDTAFIFNILREIQPDECYNFAAISFVGQSWKIPRVTMEINGEAVLNILEGIRQVSPDTRLYQAGSSEMFGQPRTNLQDESTHFNPCNPYGVAKLSAYNLVDIYRRAYGVFGANAICYNHESPLRGIEYVTRKITDGVVKIKLGLEKELRLGNIESRRDWGYAPDYIEAMWSMLQQDKAGDYVLSTGQTYSIKDFLQSAFTAVGIKDWEQYIVEDERFFRPIEPNLLCGDNSKAKKVLSWVPKANFNDMVKEMVEADINRLKIK